MSVLIKGMEMPKEGFVEILIRDDGTVQQTGQSYRIDGTDYYTPYVGEMPVMYEAVPVPPHGRLIDADELHRLFEEQWDYLQCLDWAENPKAETMQTGVNWCINTMHDDAPTIIPADKEGT